MLAPVDSGWQTFCLERGVGSKDILLSKSSYFLRDTWFLNIKTKNYPWSAFADSQAAHAVQHGTRALWKSQPPSCWTPSPLWTFYALIPCPTCLPMATTLGPLWLQGRKQNTRSSAQEQLLREVFPLKLSFWGAMTSCVLMTLLGSRSPERCCGFWLL